MGCRERSAAHSPPATIRPLEQPGAGPPRGPPSAPRPPHLQPGAQQLALARGGQRGVQPLGQLGDAGHEGGHVQRGQVLVKIQPAAVAVAPGRVERGPRRAGLPYAQWQWHQAGWKGVPEWRDATHSTSEGRDCAMRTQPTPPAHPCLHMQAPLNLIEHTPSHPKPKLTAHPSPPAGQRTPAAWPPPPAPAPRPDRPAPSPPPPRCGRR